MDKILSPTPEISVIIPTYNVAPYIERAIYSALSQKGVHIEVIMIDDASSDATLAIARKISDPRLHIIEQPQNGGPSIARNKGIAAAKGSWIAILDGDDAFDTGRLLKCLRLATDWQADIIVDNLTVYQESNRSTFPMFNHPAFKKSTILSLADFIRGNQSFLGGFTLGYLKPLFSADLLKSKIHFIL